jgi:rhodanese-related sulfurtransferase
MLLATVAGAQMKKQVPAAPGTVGVPMPVQKPGAEAAMRIKIDDAFKLYKADKAVFIDVRSKESYDQGHIKGALSIPGSQLIRRFREIPPGKTIITYCACSAEQSSGHAVVELNAHGVKNTAALQGGIHAWEDSGKPVEKSR